MKKRMTMLMAALVALAAMIAPASAGAAAPSKKASPVDQAWIEEAVRIDLSEISAGAAFDEAYPAAEVEGHMEAIKGAKLEIANGTSPVVLQAAKTDLKMFEMHLKWARAAANMGGAM